MNQAPLHGSAPVTVPPRPPTSKAYVDVRSLRRVYGSIEALKSVDLAIGPGEFVALLGPSGCGKTTLLRCIAGLVPASSGEILIDGRPMSHVPVHKRNLGMVFQSYALFPHMNVAENLSFGLKMHRVGKPDADARIAEVLNLVQMRGFETRLPAQLSGGQQQRIALARALVTRPMALLLDEPFGALDAKLRVSMQVELRRLQRSLGVTTIFVTHDQEEALSMADRVAVMRAGQIEQFDTPARVYNDPRTAFVADFIGQTNSFRGRLVSRENGRAMVALAQGHGPIPAKDNPDCAVGQEVIAMVRPERVRLLASGASQAETYLEGRTADAVFTGEKLNLYIRTSLGDIVTTIANAAPTVSTPFAAGDTVRIAWDWDALLLFNEDTG